MSEPRRPSEFWQRAWGNATVVLHRAQRMSWIDLLLAAALCGLLFGLIDLAQEWKAPHRVVTIDLSPWALPRYTFYSLSRGLIAYLISLSFTLVYGYWAAKDALAAKVLIPLLDILQSLPVLAFLPGLLLALEAAFPTSNVGLELAAILMIFTGQAWNMTFSFYHSLRSVPADQCEAATVYRFNWWQRLKWVELPFATMGLVWNSMMSMAGGWFFLMINETFQLGDRDFRLPGVGSYMKVAVDQGDTIAMLWAMLAMLTMIVLLDQALWRPIVVWSQKFRVEEGGEAGIQTSWMYDLLRRSVFSRWLRRLRRRLRSVSWNRRHPPRAPHTERLGRFAHVVTVAAFAALTALLGYGAWRLAELVMYVTMEEWKTTLLAAGVTLGRVLTSTAIGTLWALPVGLWIGLSPRLSHWLQPVIQIAASFPAPMLFPVVIGVLQWAGVSLNWGGIVLMLLGTQWYILFNVIAGAMAIPADLREVSRSYRLGLRRRFWVLYAPCVFPYLVTGWVTAAGGAWNASIVAEFVEYRGRTLTAFGLGGQISAATEEANFPLLAASVLVMSSAVVLFNRLVWKQLYRLAERRFSLSK